MSTSLTSELESGFVCDCEEWMRSACSGEPFYKEHEGKRYASALKVAEQKSTSPSKSNLKNDNTVVGKSLPIPSRDRLVGAAYAFSGRRGGNPSVYLRGPHSRGNIVDRILNLYDGTFKIALQSARPEK